MSKLKRICPFGAQPGACQQEAGEQHRWDCGRLHSDGTRRRLPLGAHGRLFLLFFSFSLSPSKDGVIAEEGQSTSLYVVTSILDKTTFPVIPALVGQRLRHFAAQPHRSLRGTIRRAFRRSPGGSARHNVACVSVRYHPDGVSMKRKQHGVPESLSFALAKRKQHSVSENLPFAF